MCIYVCIYIYISIHIHTYIYVYTYGIGRLQAQGEPGRVVVKGRGLFMLRKFGHQWAHFIFDNLARLAFTQHVLAADGATNSSDRGVSSSLALVTEVSHRVS